ncbi:hypothetical protein TA3x_002087 [Tundrisphaera sp. TA3]|uniref:hypothetical protein n=1 Tax=Tundrisphaera sp. TA3 TaxID=3435775 RepID=UPI003EBF2772
MKDAPESLNGARVILFTPIDRRHRHTGNCRQIVAGVLQGPAAGLAICLHEGEVGFYLFGCDASWSGVSDTWHMTVEEAMGQAEFEYEGVTGTWQRHS